MSDRYDLNKDAGMSVYGKPSAKELVRHAIAGAVAGVVFVLLFELVL